MPMLLRCSASAGARSCQGRPSLDRACAPAEYGSYQEARTGKISPVKVSTLSGEPRSSTWAVVWPVAPCLRRASALTLGKAAFADAARAAQRWRHAARSGKGVFK
jgi:hypothetical protein